MVKMMLGRRLDIEKLQTLQSTRKIASLKRNIAPGADSGFLVVMSEEPIDWKILYEKKTEDCNDLQISLDLSMQQADLMEEELEKQKSKLAATNLELVQTQSRLKAELAEAANYAESILPQPILEA